MFLIRYWEFVSLTLVTSFANGRCRDFVSDFDLMLQRKKEEMKKRRRRRRDVDIINDNDDLIDDIIRRMMEAAEVGASSLPVAGLEAE